MDPARALDLAKVALKKDDLERAGDYLYEYDQWRRRGGFEPPEGDARASEIGIALSKAMEAREIEREGHAWASEAGWVEDNPTMQAVANRGKPRRSNKRCAPGEIDVRRRGYRRGDGTVVAATAYCAKDQGKPGRTAYGAKGGPHSRAKGFQPWIQEKGSLGKGFLTTMSFEKQKGAMKRALSAEKKQHPGDYKGAYRSALGKIQALERNAEMRKKYGEKLRRIREWFVDAYGEGSEHWPTSRATNTGDVRRLKNRCLAIPPR